MEASSKLFIDKSWRLCTFASFIGCIILLICINHRQDTRTYSSIVVENITVPSKVISFYGYNITALDNIVDEPSTSQFNKSDEIVIRNVTIVQEEGGGGDDESDTECNVFDGTWVYHAEANPLYTNQQCPFLSDQVSCQRNGRPDLDYQNWSWEPKACQIPRCDGRDMLETLRGKRIVIVGDSINRNMFESFACLLYSSLPPSSSQPIVDVRSSIYKVFKSKEYNCSVEFYWSPFLVQLKVREVANKSSRILRLDRLSESAKMWKGADIMVFNSGHWWNHHGKFRALDLFQHKGRYVEEMEIESAYKIGMRTWARWIDHNVDRNKTSVFFRSISPEHKGNLWCYNAKDPITDDAVDAEYESAKAYPGKTKVIVESVIFQDMQTPVTYLDITKLSLFRRDAHPALYAKKQDMVLLTSEEQRLLAQSHADCSHWCLPGLPDTWNRLLYTFIVNGSTSFSLSSSLLK